MHQKRALFASAGGVHLSVVPFSTEYRTFLKHPGSGNVESEEFTGLGGKSHLDVVQMCADPLRKSRLFPTHLIPLHGEGFGSYDCLDTSMPSANGEFAVVQWLHDGDPFHPLSPLASSYFAWFNSFLDMLRED